MRIIQVNNRHRILGGSDIMAENTVHLLKKKGLDVLPLTYSSLDLGSGFSGKIRAFLYGLYSLPGWAAMSKAISMFQPDVVHIHELYPFFSPWILKVCRQAGIPVVMTCHDFRLLCPIVTLYNRGATCRLCFSGREYWCVLKNCRGNILESLAYSLRSFIARKLKLFHNNVTLFLALTKFGKSYLLETGISASRIEVIPNMTAIPDDPADPPKGHYIAFVGRISPEKGLDLLIQVARKTGLPFRVAGDYSVMPDLVQTAPANMQFLGLLGRTELMDFYRKARFLVFPSTWFEGCPMVLLEAMSMGLPIIASKIGGVGEIVEEGETGLLFDPRNAEELAAKIEMLWQRPEWCRQLGVAGRKKAVREYSKDVHFARLMGAYQKAIDIANNW